MQQNLEPNLTSTWYRYLDCLDRFCIDMELKAKLNDEQAKARSLVNVTDTMLNQHRNFKPAYCVKTGQPIGIFFNNGEGVNASIASQWLLTGERHLREHAQNEPMAFTVFTIGKLLVEGIEQDLVGIAQTVKIKARLYSAISALRASELQFIQQAIRLVIDHEITNMLVRSALIEKLVNIEHQSLTQLLDWCEQVFSQTYAFACPEITSELEFEELEHKIYTIEQRRIFASRQKHTTVSETLVANRKEALANMVQSAKPKKPVNLKKANLEAKTTVISSLLGDLF